MLLELLKHGMTDKQFSQMIAAYLIGFEITEKDLQKFPKRIIPAQGELDKGSEESRPSTPRYGFAVVKPGRYSSRPCEPPP